MYIINPKTQTVNRKVVQSLNAAMCGLWPSAPLTGDDGARMENVPLSQQPLVVHNGNVCRFVVTEIRGDWKFQKAVLVIRYS